jgi:hypothetical protein
MGPALFTFKGKENPTDMAKGAPGSYWNKTYNGWPDETTLRMWGDLMIKTKKDRGLEKMLIYVDNAGMHMDLELCAKLAQNKITIVGLIPSATSKMQPLDRAFFGGLKKKLESTATRLRVLRCNQTIAMLFETVVRELEETASKNRTSVLGHGFRVSGLVPWNPKIHPDESFAPSDLRLGIRKDDAAVKAARARGAAVSSDIIAAVIESHSTAGMEKLSALAKAKRLARLARAAGSGTTDEGDIDEYGGVHRNIYTSVSFQTAQKAKKDALEAEEKAAKAAAVIRAANAEKNRAEKAARSAAWKAKIAASKAKREAEAAEKAARAAAKAAAIAPKPAAKAAKRARDEDEGPVAYAKTYKKRARK